MDAHIHGVSFEPVQAITEPSFGAAERVNGSMRSECVLADPPIHKVEDEMRTS